MNMKKMKKIICMLLCCCMIFGLTSTSVFAAGKEDVEIKNQVIAEGFCGTATNLKGETVANVWQLTSKGVLTITGAYNANKQPILMPAYGEIKEQAPWADYRRLIRAVVIDGVLANISSYAFADCYALTTVSLTENIKLIGEGAFTGCNSLTTVEIPASVNAIGSKAFAGCSSLEKVTILGETTEFDVDTFNTDVNQLDFYVYMGSWADEFLYDENLYDVFFLDEEPTTPTEPERVAGGTCGTARPINGNTYANIWILTDDGVLTITGNYDSIKTPIRMPAYSADGSNPAPWSKYADQITEVVIEGVLPNISDGAFANCTNLIKVNISESVSAIGTDAFYGCRNLSNVTIPATVETIASDAFAYCAGLEKVYILGKETQIGRDAFYGANDLTIYGYIDSEADAYAAQYNIPFVSLDETLTTTPVTELFSDVSEGDWYVDAVQYVNDNGLMTGSNGKFNPTKNITRAQFVTTLYRLAGEPTVTDFSACELFPDVLRDQYYTNAVCWAYKAGITTGSNGIFNTNGNLTRQQMATFFYRYTDYTGHGTNARTDISAMLNANKVSPYAKDAVEWAVAVGLINGKPTGTYVNGAEVFNLDPEGSTTRAQQAQVLKNYCTSGNIY